MTEAPAALVRAACAATDTFVGHLLGRLPENLVFPPEEPEVPAHAARFFKKGAVTMKKEVSKQNKRAKFDRAGDEQPSAGGDGGDGDNDDEGDDEGVDAAMDDDEEAVEIPDLPLYDRDGAGLSLDVLRSRLQDKLAGLRGARHAPTEAVESAQMKKRDAKKLKLQVSAPSERANDRAPKRDREEPLEDEEQVEGEEDDSHDGTTVAATVDDVRFGALRQPKRALPNKVGAPGSKVKRLKALAAKAEGRAEALRELKQGGDDSKADKMQWSEALQVASGDRKMVDPKKIKKALKAREKKKDKSTKAWKTRLAVQEQAKPKGPRPSGKRKPKEEIAKEAKEKKKASKEKK
ncbi:hypothetical protein M885DRAFT_610403 [Pelagophyceae sp. CCMP2097]|nr:hypothetical protein M885DRAFT_610403 [Pelagophyceae sp. CCMP2097]